MPLIQCIDADRCKRSNCRFIHPDQPQWPHAIESNLTKKRRAEAAAGGYEQDSGYGPRPRGRDSTRRASATSSTAGWGDGKASTERSRREPSPGWGPPISSGGWGSNSTGGWGAASPAHGDWGTSGNDDWGAKSGDTSGNAWGNSSAGARANPEPTSRRTSFSAPKSPVKPPTSPRQHHSTSSREKDRDRKRERQRDRDRDRDRDRRREEGNASPSRSHRSNRRSPSPSGSSRRESNHSPDRSKSKTSTAANDSMDIELPNPPSIEATSSLFAPIHKDSSAASVPALATTTQPVATTPTTEMPISIPFPRARQPDGLPPAPLGFAASRPTPPLPSAQSMPPPPAPLGFPPVIPPPPPTALASKSPSRSPPQSSDANKTHGLPTRPRATGSRSPPQTRTLATPMVPPARSTPATPVTPATPTAPVTPTTAPVAPAPPAPAIATPSAPVTPATPPVVRPYEWIESLESLIKQNQVLQNCKKQYKRAEAQEQILLSRGTSAPKRGTGDTAPSLADLRRRIESTESDMQALMAQFAMRMDMFHRPSAIVTHVDAGEGNEEALSMARKLSDQVSLLESEMQLLQINTAKSEELKKLEESVKGSSQAILKERGERTKAVEDMKKDVKVLGDDLNRTRIECERLREELISGGSNLEQVRCDAQTVREQQSTVKEEVKAIKLEAGATKADVQTVKTGMGEVGKEVTEIKAELEKLRKRLKTPPPVPASVPVLAPTTTPGKRARNGVFPNSNAMEVDEVLPPAKRVRTVDPLRPSPFIDSTTPFGSPRHVRDDGPSRKELLERIDTLEDLVETLQGDIIQVGTDVQDQLEEFNERLGLSEGRVVNMAAVTDSRSESAPPGTTIKSDFVRAAGRSSAPPTQTTFPPSWVGSAKLPSVEELPSDEVIGQLQIDLDSMMEQVVGLWEGEGEWPAHIKMNLCKALGIESLEDVFKSAPAPAPVPVPVPVVNGKTPQPEGDWVAMLKSMQEEQANMREEMKKERAEQDARMKAMVERMERTEEALDKSVKRRDEVERECDELKARQAEQKQLIVHLQSIVDSLPKPGNGMLSPEGLLQDAVRNGASPVQQELAALRKLATTVPHLLALAGLSAEKEN